MYMLGAHIVSKYSGTDYRDFVQERIFKPLNMTSTTYHGDAAEATGLLSQCWNSDGRRISYILAGGDTVSKLMSGAGGAITSAVDLVRCAADITVVTRTLNRRCRRSGLLRC